jgi:nucleoredoxin
MRSILICFLCLAAVGAGVILATILVRYPFALARIYNDGTAVVTSASTPPAPDEPGWHDGTWTPPTDIPAHANWTWQTSDGKTYENVVITNITSTEVAITYAQGVAHIPLDDLPHDVQRELQYNPNGNVKNPAAGAVALTPVSSMIDKKLVDAQGQPVDTPGASIKYYAIYYSAGWCPPCHTFTPVLVDWYQKFKPFHHNFELIFVSEDKTEMDMYGYMNEMKMPWPAVRFSELPRANGTFRGPGIQQYAHDGIPDLVLVDSSGNILADSFKGANYVGPQTVVDYMNSNLSLN